MLPIHASTSARRPWQRVLRTSLPAAAIVLVVFAATGCRLARAADNEWQAGYSAVRVVVNDARAVGAAVGEVEAAGGHIAVAVPPAIYPGEAVLLGWVTPSAGAA